MTLPKAYLTLRWLFFPISGLAGSAVAQIQPASVPLCKLSPTCTAQDCTVISFKKNPSCTTNLIYKSAKTDVVTIDASGKITPVGIGPAKISASIKNDRICESQEISCQLNVVDGKPLMSLAGMQKRYGDASFDIPYAADSGNQFTYTSSNPKVATIVGKTVTITGSGETTITAEHIGSLSTSGIVKQVSATLRVGPGRLQLSDIRSANYQQAYKVALTATGGYDPYTYKLAANSALPSWLSLNNGVLSGAAPKAGDRTHTFPARFSIVATDKNGMSVTKDYTLGIGKIGIFIGANQSHNYRIYSVPYGSTVNPKQAQVAFFDQSSGNNSGLHSLIDYESDDPTACAVEKSADGKVTLTGKRGGTNTSIYAYLKAQHKEEYECPVDRGNHCDGKRHPKIEVYQCQVTAIAQALTVDTSSSSVCVYGQQEACAVSARSTSGLAVAYSTSTNNVCAVDAVTGVVTYKKEGHCRIDFAQNGNSNYHAAPAISSHRVVMEKAAQVITFSQPTATSSAYGVAPINLVATSSSGLPVSFSTTSNKVCAIVNNNQVKFIDGGQCIVHAIQKGDDNYAPAISVLKELVIDKPSLVFNIKFFKVGLSPR